MPVIKPKFDGSEDTGEGARYEGPPPTPGPYQGTVKKLWLAPIASGDNEGEDQIKVLVEVSDGKFKGAGFFHNLPLLKQTNWKVNQFLHALTDGSDKQKEVLRDWFWHKGYDVDPESDNVGQPINKIMGGKKGFVPHGKPIAFIVKNDSYNGAVRPIIDRFIVPQEDSEPAEEESDGLEEFQQPVPVAAVPDPEPSPVEDTVDSDDPWS